MYLWIDPGIRKLWYGLIDKEWQVVDSWIILQSQKKPTRNDQFARMVELVDFFDTMLHDFPIQAIWMEKLFFTTRNQNNAEFVYWARGCLCMLFRRHTIPLYERTPQEIKKYVTGNGSASKEHMLAFVKKIFSLTDDDIKRHDAADGLGIALMVKNKRENELRRKTS